MSELNEVFGNDYHKQAYQSRVDHILNVITNNIAHRTFTYRLDGCDLLWNNDYLDSNIIKRISERVHELNPKLTIKHIDTKHPVQKKILPFLLENTPAEYFYIIDEEMLKCYLIFITPSQIGAF